MSYNTELLSFFNQRASILKQTSRSEDFCVNFLFLVNNKKNDNDNSIEITDIETLKNTVEEYFKGSNIDYKNNLFISEYILKDKQLFVDLILF